MSDRETELQADNTRLITELRMVRAQLNAAETILNQALVERPVTVAMAIAMGIDPSTMQSENKRMKALYERVKLLENDAWTMTGPLARQFVKAVNKGIAEENLGNFVNEWADKFEALDGDGD